LNKIAFACGDFIMPGGVIIILSISLRYSLVIYETIDCFCSLFGKPPRYKLSYDFAKKKNIPELCVFRLE